VAQKATAIRMAAKTVAMTCLEFIGYNSFEIHWFQFAVRTTRQVTCVPSADASHAKRLKR
jgi:hypothetical protein